ncbi:MAG: ParB/RepB/Spo0J family partition protein [Ignavibacteriae bacterium]|nr:MAG: ParB/RepB/Spo0J family partition protein [Ignavibacteriota bacterium]
MSDQKKSVLGRGLNALIPKNPRMEVNVRDGSVGRDTGETGIIASIDIVKIQPNPFQPRTDFDQDSLSELTRSIQEKGVIQPITVRRIDGGYQLISGERRLRATQAAHLRQIPAYIIAVESDEEMLELALIENIQREYLNSMEIASAYQRLIDECRMTQDDIAKRVGKDRSTITNFIRLLKLPGKIQDGLRKEKISMGHARALIALPHERMQLRLYEKIVDGGLSVRKVEELVRATQQPRKKSGPHQSNSGGSASIQNLEERLRQALGTKVKVKTKGSGRGEIIVEYYSLDDFDRLMDLFSGK